MNPIYRLFWHALDQTWVAADETARGSGQAARAALTLAACLATPLPAWAQTLPSNALPTGGQVTAGSASISQAANVLTVNQASQRAALDWQSFNIGSAATVNFVQPNASAVALNRIIGNTASEIYGKLNANGQVFFSNPAGVLFGAGAQVNVGGLMATTLNISNSGFMAGNNNLTGGAGNTGVIRNQGLLSATGSVALVANTVENVGQIIATTATLAAGNTVALDLTGDGLIRVRVTDASLQATLENSGAITATQAITLTSGQARAALNSAVNTSTVNNTGTIKATGLVSKGGDIYLESANVKNSGLIEARTPTGGQAGTIFLLGDMKTGTVMVGGTLDASAPVSGNGGFIETSAATVKVDGNANVTTLAAGGASGTWLIDPKDFNIAASGGDITGTALSSNLGRGSVTIQSTSGNSGTSGNVNVSDTVTWSANKLTLNAQNNININAPLTGSGTASLALEYGQAAVSAGNTSVYNVNAPVTLPAGDNFSTKLGSDGALVSYKVITSLGATGSTTGADLQGMAGNLSDNYALGASINASATSGWSGGFNPIGLTTAFSGILDGLGNTVNSLTINRPSVDSVGLFGETASTARIRNLGLVGGSMSGKDKVGSLVGNNGGTISNSFATSTVNGSGNYVGGLVGYNFFGEIYNSYATGSVVGVNYVGGLVGGLYGVLSKSFSSGSVSGSSSVGGLVGDSSSATITSSYWDSQTSGRSSSAGGDSRTTAQMQTLSNFSGFDISSDATGSSIWKIVEGVSYPKLRFSTVTSTANSTASSTTTSTASTTTSDTTTSSQSAITVAVATVLPSNSTTGTSTASTNSAVTTSSATNTSTASTDNTTTGTTSISSQSSTSSDSNSTSGTGSNTASSAGSTPAASTTTASATGTGSTTAERKAEPIPVFIKTVTVAGNTVTKPADQIVTPVSKKGNSLSCRRTG